jgi:hypothetical protein
MACFSLRRTIDPNSVKTLLTRVFPSNNKRKTEIESFSWRDELLPEERRKGASGIRIRGGFGFGAPNSTELIILFRRSYNIISIPSYNILIQNNSECIGFLLKYV